MGRRESQPTDGAALTTPLKTAHVQVFSTAQWLLQAVRVASCVLRAWRVTCLGLVICLTLSSLVPSPPSHAQTSLRTAADIKADYERRRAKLIDALLSDSGGNLWHDASRGLATVYKEPDPPLQALMNLAQAASADPKCEECCDGPTTSRCGDGAGYWSLPLLIRAYYLFNPHSTFEDGRYAGRLPYELSARIAGFYRSYLSKSAGKGYGGCGANAQPRCTGEYTLDRYNFPPYKYISQSDNHTILQASTIYLAAQMLRDEGPQYAELYENWKGWWSRFLDGLAKRGFWETASATYVERHLAPIVNLYDFCQDPLIKKKAEMVLDWYWAEIAQELIHGVRGGAKMRVYGTSEGDRGALSATNDAMYGVYYLYFGDSQFNNNPRMPNAEMYSAIFATSSYRPPDLILELGANPEARGSYEIKQRRKGSCFVWDNSNQGDQPYNSRRYAYVTPDYVLGSFQTDADKQFMPLAGQAPHMQNSLVFATSPEARIAWGERGYISSGHINVFQHKNVVIASKAGHPELRLTYSLPPAGILDQVDEEGEWLFVKEGTAYAAIRRFHEISIIEAARSRDYGDDFEQFKAAIRQTELGLVPTEIDAGFIQYVTTNKDVMWFPLIDSDGACRYTCDCHPADEKLPKINGQVVDWNAYPLFASPYVHSEWDSGLVEVLFSGQQLTLDFRDPNSPVKTESGAVAPSATPTRTATATVTGSPTTTATPSVTVAPPGTPGPTPSRVPTLRRTAIPGPGRTPTRTASPTTSASPAATATQTTTAEPAESTVPTPSPTCTLGTGPAPTHTGTTAPEPSPTQTNTLAPPPTPTHTSSTLPMPTATATSTVQPLPAPTLVPGEGQSQLSKALDEIVAWLRYLLGSFTALIQNAYR